MTREPGRARPDGLSSQVAHRWHDQALALPSQPDTAQVVRPAEWQQLGGHDGLVAAPGLFEGRDAVAASGDAEVHDGLVPGQAPRRPSRTPPAAAHPPPRARRRRQPGRGRGCRCAPCRRPPAACSDGTGPRRRARTSLRQHARSWPAGPLLRRRPPRRTWRERQSQAIFVPTRRSANQRSRWRGMQDSSGQGAATCDVSAGRRVCRSGRVRMCSPRDRACLLELVARQRASCGTT